MTNYRCTHGHDRCGQMYAGPDCPYCEPARENGETMVDNLDWLSVAEVERLRDALEEILDYRGGADSALEDEYVMSRARAALAEGSAAEPELASTERPEGTNNPPQERSDGARTPPLSPWREAIEAAAKVADSMRFSVMRLDAAFADGKDAYCRGAQDMATGIEKAIRALVHPGDKEKEET